MRSCELVATITAIACTIANNYSEDEIGVMAAAFSQLGDTLETILAQESCIANVVDANNEDSSNENTNKDKNEDANKDECHTNSTT